MLPMRRPIYLKLPGGARPCFEYVSNKGSDETPQMHRALGNSC